MRILCATDLLAKSEAAIERAGLLSDQLQADLTLLHVVEPVPSERAFEQTLQAALAHARSRAEPPMWRAERRPSVAVRAGNAPRIILDTAAQLNARLVVLGPHRRRPVRDALEGTIAEKALATRSAPVLVVRNEARGAYRRVLLALDLSDASASAVRAAESLVLAPEVEARIVHAHEPPYQGMLHYAGAGTDSLVRYAEGWKREAMRVVEDLLKYESAHAARYDIVINERPAAPGILRAVEHFEPDLLVMGTRGRGRLHRALLGSVANRVLHEIESDVLIVPEGSFGASRSKIVLGQRHARVSKPASAGRHASGLQPSGEIAVRRLEQTISRSRDRTGG
jgi:universal stress protein E